LGNKKICRFARKGLAFSPANATISFKNWKNGFIGVVMDAQVFELPCSKRQPEISQEGVEEAIALALKSIDSKIIKLESQIRRLTESSFTPFAREGDRRMADETRRLGLEAIGIAAQFSSLGAEALKAATEAGAILRHRPLHPEERLKLSEKHDIFVEETGANATTLQHILATVADHLALG
jgi:hypothetical protein